MGVVHRLTGPDLDLIMHSPGGSAEAAEAFVAHLRSKFDHIRVIVLQLAMSAATMIACAADVIVLGKHSFLGPIDPQLMVGTPLGIRIVPAQAILEQFEQAKRECTDPAKMGAWLPMLGQYGPDLLVQCRDASEMSRRLVRDCSRRSCSETTPRGRPRPGRSQIGSRTTVNSRATGVISQGPKWNAEGSISSIWSRISRLRTCSCPSFTQQHTLLSGRQQLKSSKTSLARLSPSRRGQ
jgi:hypothetical protein